MLDGGRLPDGASDEERAAHDAATGAHMKAVIDIQKRIITLWCYLVVVLDSTSLMLTRHDCVDSKGLGDRRKASILLQQRFRSDETVTMFNVMRQQARLQVRKDEVVHNFFYSCTGVVHQASTCGRTSLRTLAECDGAQWFA